MFGFHSHSGRQADGPAAAPTSEADAPPASDLLTRFAARRAGSYSVLFEEMRSCRSAVELASVQQRWWLGAMQDYAGFWTTVAAQAGPPRLGEPEVPPRGDGGA